MFTDQNLQQIIPQVAPHHSQRLPYSQSWAGMRSCTQRQCMNGTLGNAALQQKDYANMLYVHLDCYAKAARVPQKRRMMKPDVVPRGHTVHCNMRHQHCKGSSPASPAESWRLVSCSTRDGCIAAAIASTPRQHNGCHQLPSFMTLAFSMMLLPSLYFSLSSRACSYFQPRTVLHVVQ